MRNPEPVRSGMRHVAQYLTSSWIKLRGHLSIVPRTYIFERENTVNGDNTDDWLCYQIIDMGPYLAR